MSGQLGQSVGYLGIPALHLDLDELAPLVHAARASTSAWPMTSSIAAGCLSGG